VNRFLGVDATHRLANLTLNGTSAISLDALTYINTLSLNSSGSRTFAQNSFINTIDLNGFSNGTTLNQATINLAGASNSINNILNSSTSSTSGSLVLNIPVTTGNPILSLGDSANVHDFSALASINFNNNTSTLNIATLNGHDITLGAIFENAGSTSLQDSSSLIVTDSSIGNLKDIIFTKTSDASTPVLTMRTTDNSVTTFNNSWTFATGTVAASSVGELTALSPVIITNATASNLYAINIAQTVTIQELGTKLPNIAFISKESKLILDSGLNAIDVALQSNIGGTIVSNWSDGKWNIATPTDSSGSIILNATNNPIRIEENAFGFGSPTKRISNLSLVGNARIEVPQQVYAANIVLNSSAPLVLNSSAEANFQTIIDVQQETTLAQSNINNAIINLGTNGLILGTENGAPTSHVLTGNNIINTSLADDASNGGHLVVQDNVILDLSGATIVVNQTSAGIVPAAGTEFQYKLFEIKNGGTITQPTNLTFHGATENPLIIWHYDPITGLVASTTDITALPSLISGSGVSAAAQEAAALAAAEVAAALAAAQEAAALAAAQEAAALAAAREAAALAAQQTVHEAEIIQIQQDNIIAINLLTQQAATTLENARIAAITQQTIAVQAQKDLDIAALAIVQAQATLDRATSAEEIAQAQQMLTDTQTRFTQAQTSLTDAQATVITLNIELTNVQAQQIAIVAKANTDLAAIEEELNKEKAKSAQAVQELVVTQQAVGILQDSLAQAQIKIDAKDKLLKDANAKIAALQEAPVASDAAVTIVQALTDSTNTANTEIIADTLTTITTTTPSGSSSELIAGTPAAIISNAESLVPNEINAAAESADVHRDNIQNRTINTQNDMMPDEFGMQESGLAAGDSAGESGAWISPFYGQIRQKKLKDSAGYVVASAGGSFGFDHNITDNNILGIAYTFVNEKMKYRDQFQGDKASANSNLFALYGSSKLLYNFFLSYNVGYGITNVKKNEKRIVTGGIANTTGKYKSKTILSQLMLGHTFRPNSIFKLVPTIDIKFSQFNDDAYTYLEHGAVTGSWGVGKKSSYLVDSTIGLKIAANYQYQNSRIVPELSAAAHLFIKDSKTKTKIISNALDKVLPLSGQSPNTWYSANTGLKIYNGSMEYAIRYEVEIDKKYLGQKGVIKIKANF
jgi:hypothetical protein